jgi:hypothetical protein
MFPLSSALKPLTLFSILKGIIWLLIITVAGIPPVASSTSCPVCLLSHRHMNDPGIHFFEPERYCYSLLRCIDEGHQTERDSPCQFRSTSYVLMYHLMGEALTFGTSQHRCFSSPRWSQIQSLRHGSIALWQTIPLGQQTCTLHPSIPFFSRAHYCRRLPKK